MGCRGSEVQIFSLRPFLSLVERAVAANRPPGRANGLPPVHDSGLLFPHEIQHSTGQARVTLNGKTFYLGRYGNAAATTAYGELIAKWTKNGRQPLVPEVDVEQMRPMREVFARWEQHLDAAGRYRKNGRPTSPRQIVAVAVREFCERFGDVPASSYYERHLLQHRDTLKQRPTLGRQGSTARNIGVQVPTSGCRCPRGLGA
jgi:hypothetical protein